MAGAAALITLGQFVFIGPVLAIYWQEEFGLSEKEAGQMFSYMYIGLFVGYFLFPVIVRWLALRAWLFISLFF